MAQFVDIPRKHNARGVDSYSARGNIQEGYAERLENFDTNTSGKLATRKGYQGYAGYVPLRVTKASHSGTNITLEFDSSQTISLATVGQGPIIVSGTVPAADAPEGGYAGDFSTAQASHYYASYTLNNTDVLTSGNGTLTKTADQHGLATPYMFVGIAESVSTVGNSYDVLWPDDVTINNDTYQVDIDYTVNEDVVVKFYYLDCSSVAGTTYIKSVTAETTVSISSAEHALTNWNVLVKCFDTATSAGELIEVEPDSITISTTGTVTITFDTAFTGDIILTRAPLNNVASSVPVAGTNHLTFPVDSPFNFYAIYEFDGTDYSATIPDSISYDDTTGQVTVGFTVAGAALAVEIYHIPAAYIANIVTITDTEGVEETWSTERPQLTVWGFNHDSIYLTDTKRGGHVNHIDTYKTTTEERLICGLGGNLFAARTKDEVGDTYLMPELWYNLRSRSTDSLLLAPAFQPTGSTSQRSRGIITDDSIEQHCATITSVTYISPGVVDYTLSFSNKSGNIEDGGILSVNKDYLTVTGMAHDVNNGTFLITSVVSDSPTETTLRVENSSAINDIYNEINAQGKAGLFTDIISLTHVPFVVGDVLHSDALDENSQFTVRYADSTNVIIDNVSEEIEVPDGVVIFGQRTSHVLPLRDFDGPNVENIVRGDMLAVEGFNQLIRVLNVGVSNNIPLTLTGDGSVVTAQASTAHRLSPGQHIFIVDCATTAYTGEHVVLTTPDETTFTFASTFTGADTAALLGHCVEVDEQLTMQDMAGGVVITVPERWIPIEAPVSNYDLPPDTYTRHFDQNDYDSQPHLRSTMVQDTMYFTNGQDEVMKFDGHNVYRAGLIKWQPALFVQLDTTTSLTSAVTSVAYTNKSQAEMWFEVPLGTSLSAGERIEDSGDGAIYTVVDVTDDSTVMYVYVDRAISDASTTGTISQTAARRYYARLNAIDSNNNIIASAVTDANDLIVEFAIARQPRLRFVGPPAFDLLDYERIELELYRTVANTVAPFYLTSRQLVNFDNQAGYIDVYDGTPDEALRDLDVVSSALEGGELGVGWDGPLRATSITSVDNRLILSNVKSYPELDLTMRLKPTSVAITAGSLDGTSFLLRADNTDEGTVPNMVDRARYTFVKHDTSSGKYTISSISDNGGKTRITLSTGLTEDVAAGSWIYCYHAVPGTNNDLTYAGWYQVAADAAATDTTLDLNVPYTSSSNGVDSLVMVTASTKSVPVLVGVDGNHNEREGNVTSSYEGVAVRRLAQAINASMRMTDITIEGQESFRPYVTAFAGNDYNLGQLKLVKPFVSDDTPELVLPTLSGAESFQLFANRILRESEEQVSFETRLFPSRVLRSYPKFPEIFDTPTATQAETSLSAVNVNESDGQSVTVSIPFFSESTFSGTGNLNQVVLVFKERSIYAWNVLTGELQKLDSRGLGCTAPLSVAPTKNGVMFVNESGIYRVNRDLTVDPVGKLLTGLWKGHTNRNALIEFTGHQYALGRKYKLSFVAPGDLYNSKVYVYDHDSEGDGQQFGAWTTYTNHPATGWANSGQDAFFASTSGDVFSVRRLEEPSDYRDDAAAVAEQVAVLRPEDFDVPASRKLLSHITTQLDLELTSVSNLGLQVAINLSTSFEAAGVVTVDRNEHPSIAYRSAIPKRKATHYQTKLVHAAKDKAVVITGLSYRVSALSNKGVKEAADLT